MASFTLKLSDYTLRKLTEAAREAGVTPERMAEMMVEACIRADDDLLAPTREPAGVGEPARAWAGGTSEGAAEPDQGARPEDYEGPFVDLDDALDDFSTELQRRLKSPTG